MGELKVYLLSEVHIATLMPFSLNLCLYVLEYATMHCIVTVLPLKEFFEVSEGFDLQSLLLVLPSLLHHLLSSCI